MKLEKYQRQVAKIANPDLTLCALWLNEESGEVAKLVKKALKYREKLDKEALIEELGDTLVALAALANEQDLSLDDIAEVSLKKLEDNRSDWQ